MFEWVPSIEMGQALVLFIVVDIIILFAVIIKLMRRGGKPSNGSPTPTPPSTKPNKREKIYYDLEESATEGEGSDELKIVAKALQGRKNRTLLRHPSPAFTGVSPEIQALVHKAKDPNLFMSAYGDIPIQRKIDATLRGNTSVVDEEKRKRLDREMIA